MRQSLGESELQFVYKSLAASVIKWSVHEIAEQMALHQTSSETGLAESTMCSLGFISQQFSLRIPYGDGEWLYVLTVTGFFSSQVPFLLQDPDI